MDLEHVLIRLGSRFDPESRYYWPLVIAVLLAIVATVVWYYWPASTPAAGKRRWARAERARASATDGGGAGDDLPTPSPAELELRPWALWTNIVFCIWALVLLIAKTPFWLIPLSLAIDAGILVYLYAVRLPPQEAAWARELRRERDIPRAERRRRRR